MSRTRVTIFGAATVAAMLWGLPLHAQDTESDGRPVLTVGTLEGITLDGRLDEPAWSAADSIARLTEVEPSEGDVPGARTVVKVLADADALVIGVAAYQSDDVPAVSFARAPDSELRNEDHVQIVLDTFLDGRSGYVFSVNPAGARYDALISIQGGANKSWDGVWDAHTSRDGSTWFAEIWIPIRTLTFADGLARWGFNVERRIQSLQETDRWSGASLDYQIDQTSRAGYLDGLPSFGLGLGLSVRPAFTTGAGKPAPDTTFVSTVHPSLDVTQALGPNLLASLTVNTDFAETEVDTRRTNFTRFPLFFPEKRSFFLEGADIFDFGAGGQDVIPFFSRRIGLVEGTSVPLSVGGKVNGRVGGTSVGALVARTRDADGLDTRATMGVVRLRQNVLAESTVGFMGAFGDPLGRSGSWMLGPDLTFQTSRLGGSKNFSVGAWGLVMRRDSLGGDRTAGGLRVAYPNDLVNATASYTRIGEAFDPSLGFVPRPGVHIANLEVNWQPRPGQVGPLAIRQCFWENRLTYVAGLSGGWQSYRYFMAPINCRLESGDRFEANFVPQGERLSAPFDVANGVSVPAGSYHFRRYRLEAGLAPKRAFSAQATWWFGGFYDGKLHQIQLTSSWNPTSLLNIEVNGEHDIGHMPGGDFTADLWGVRLNVNVSPDLQIASFVQYDTEGHALGTNTRLRWAFSPLGALFLVYNHNLVDTDPSASDSWSFRRLRFDSNQLLVKAQYVLRY